MTIIVRLALPEDCETIVAMGANNVAETCPEEDYDRDMARATFRRYLDTASPTIFVAEKNRKVIGFLKVYVYGYDYRAGLYTAQKVLYVEPAHRGSRASALLIRHLITWSRSIGADRIVGGNDNSFRSERTAKFLEHFGFERVGFAMRKTLTERSSGLGKRR